MTTEHIRQRSEILGTQVITRDTGKRLGVVSQLWVDIDRRQVVALGVRENILAMTALPRYMRLSEIGQIGDVILVEDEQAIEDDLDVEGYSNLIQSEVITETGDLLGRVRGFKFDTEDGTLVSLIIASIGIPQIPEQILSTYELPIEEIVSSGPNRLIVFENAQERLSQLSVGVLERLGLGTAPWEREEDEEYYSPVARPENQLASGVRTAPIPERTQAPPVAAEAWSEDDDWRQTPASLRERDPQPIYAERPEEVYVEYEEEDNWNETSRDHYQQMEYEPEPSKREEKYPEYAEYDEYEDIEADAWASDEDRRASYQAPKVNLPSKTKIPEYEEESGY
ncbi:MAG: PRC-barrel domain containing protein [Cyanobacteria bacterium J055]|nr:MAG: PRC-barrel domain containing protein [Cyanobacteria bacterium J055]